MNPVRKFGLKIRDFSLNFLTFNELEFQRKFKKKINPTLKHLKEHRLLLLSKTLRFLQFPGSCLIALKFTQYSWAFKLSCLKMPHFHHWLEQIEPTTICAIRAKSVMYDTWITFYMFQNFEGSLLPENERNCKKKFEVFKYLVRK